MEFHLGNFSMTVSIYEKPPKKISGFLGHPVTRAINCKIRTIIQRKWAKIDPFFIKYFVLAITFYRKHFFDNHFHRWSRFYPYFLKTPIMVIFMAILCTVIMAQYDQNAHIEPLWPYLIWPPIWPLWVSLENIEKI